MPLKLCGPRGSHSPATLCTYLAGKFRRRLHSLLWRWVLGRFQVEFSGLGFGVGWAPRGAIQKLGYAGVCTQRTVFFSKRRKNSSLCAEHPAVYPSLADAPVLLLQSGAVSRHRVWVI
ncbi:hypothetical protein KC19_10G095900 [Ceratodon purpureus]|uniref:Uncharacterized protein n=1 Tax=Ceratodon purpureus TaxID=3225 RepID=A0A8T0GL72_CERPU|nr:hypothetical protein KC19_10G095900 [Ceratodon purpureus]